MRQINIKQLKNNLSKELLNLPFEITKYGQVVATILEGSHEITKNNIKTVNESDLLTKDMRKKLPELIAKKKKVATLKAALPTGEIPFRPCPKQGKK